MQVKFSWSLPHLQRHGGVIGEFPMEPPPPGQLLLAEALWVKLVRIEVMRACGFCGLNFGFVFAGDLCKH